MRNFKRFFAATLALVMLSTTSVFAQDSPQNILSQANTNSLEQSTLRISGNIEGFIQVLFNRLDLISMDIDFAVQIDPETMEGKLYIRAPMEINFPTFGSGELIEISIEIAYFSDGLNHYAYMSGEGWMDANDFFDLLSGTDVIFIGYDVLVEWYLVVSELIYGLIPLEFAPQQPEGYYVIEANMDIWDILYLFRGLLTVEFFESFFILWPEEDVAALTAQDWEAAEAALEESREMFDFLIDILADAQQFGQYGFALTLRNHIDTHARFLQLFDFDIMVYMPFEVGLGVTFNGGAVLTGSFEFDYDPDIVWPEIILITEVIS